MECDLISAKVTDPNIINATAILACVTQPLNLGACTTDQEPEIGVRLRKLNELASSTLRGILGSKFHGPRP